MSVQAENIKLSPFVDNKISENVNTKLPVDDVFAQEEDWKNDYEKYFETKYSKQLMNSQSISYTLRRIDSQTGKKSAVVYMIVEDKLLELILLTPETLPIHKTMLAPNQEALFEKIKQLQIEISSPKNINNKNYLTSSQQLYNWLIAPIAKDLKAQNIDTFKAEALRQAQIAMLRGQIQIKKGQLYQIGLTRGITLPPKIAEFGDLNLSHPYYWAAFTVIGSPW